ncbi:MAG: hypothetical protein HY204_02735 [Nitrospirae bacterium]|nr:hypothetical protein [Nitrospirota bacterium]
MRKRCSGLRSRLIQDGLYQAPKAQPDVQPDATDAEASTLTWRISPEPFWIAAEELRAIQELGSHLLSFYAAVNRLYFASVRGSQPGWISRYLDLGKPEGQIEYGRMNRIKPHLPGVIRPDLILTEDGWIATELDSVPGGIGLTGSLSRHYAELGHAVIGGPDGMVNGFATMIRSVTGSSNPTLAIIVSEESKDYRPEMRWLGSRLNTVGLKTFVIRPDEIRFTEEGLAVLDQGAPMRIDVVYRFFELFDLKNIPKSELILYSAKKEKVTITPPAKTYLEEKMAFALFHHPALRTFWSEALGEKTDAALLRIFPKTWILDPQEVPPYAVIPGLTIGGRPVSNWNEMASLTQKERRFVLKPSGFSERAWGSRGVVVGHDLPEKEWARTLTDAPARFSHSPSILQEFHGGKKFSVWYDDPMEPHPQSMAGRVRLSPYYFVTDGQAELGGILATICPSDKKLIHGMTEAVMVPCVVKP